MAAIATFIEAGKAKMLGDITTATRLYNTCILADPENDAAYYELASIYLDQNDASTAFRLSEKAYQRYNNSLYLVAISAQNTRSSILSN